jgi:cytochrome c
MRLALALLCVGCSGSLFTPARATVQTGGDADRGERVIADRRCGACHDIPGIRGANGVVGPPLQRFALRSYVAGQLPNTPENLVRWVQNPRAVEPKTAMPALGLSESEARDVAAYLYTLR